MTIVDDLPPALVWSDDDAPGIGRRRAGTGFSYAASDGSWISDARVLGRIRKLAIPPAWTDVWICTSANGHLQATGRDARGRKQYRYHPGFRAHRDASEVRRLADFGEALVRRSGARWTPILPAAGIPREKVLATIVGLLEETLVRVGNEEYARANGSFGLTTLRNRHAKFTSDGLRLVFKGKHGLATNVPVQDRRLRRIVKQCQDLPGHSCSNTSTRTAPRCRSRPPTSTRICATQPRWM